MQQLEIEDDSGHFDHEGFWQLTVSQQNSLAAFEGLCGQNILNQGRSQAKWQQRGGGANGQNSLSVWRPIIRHLSFEPIKISNVRGQWDQVKLENKPANLCTADVFWYPVKLTNKLLMADMFWYGQAGAITSPDCTIFYSNDIVRYSPHLVHPLVSFQSHS